MDIFSSWQKLPLKNRSQLPDRAGLYAVLDQWGHAWYVGKSTNLRQRWAGGGHHRYQQACEEIGRPRLAWKDVPESEIHHLETQLIRYCKAHGQADWNNTSVPDYTAPVPFWDWLTKIPAGWLWAAAALAIIFLPGDGVVPTFKQTGSEFIPVYNNDGRKAYQLPRGSVPEVQRCDHEAGVGFVEWRNVRGWVYLDEFSQGSKVCK